MFIDPSKVQTSCYQECNDSKVPECAKAPGFGLGCLNQRGQAFEKAIVNVRFFPLHDAFPVGLDCAGSIDHGLDTTMRCPEVPALEHEFKEFWCRHFVNFLKVFPDMQGFYGFQIQARH